LTASWLLPLHAPSASAAAPPIRKTSLFMCFESPNDLSLSLP
jgi:hypothetical protein